MIVDPAFPLLDKLAEDISKGNFKSEYSFTKELLLQAYKFGYDQYQTSKEKRDARGQTDPTRNIRQNQGSKITEEMNYTQLSPYLSGLSKPDWVIYDKKNKNWDHDLADKTTDPVVNLAVKSQETSMNTLYDYPISWVFEYRAGSKYDTDKGIFSEEAQQPGHFVLFNSIDLENKRGELKAIISVAALHKLKLFEPMKKADLQSNKVAVYLGTLAKKDFRTL